MKQKNIWLIYIDFSNFDEVIWGRAIFRVDDFDDVSMAIWSPLPLNLFKFSGMLSISSVEFIVLARKIERE